MPLEVTDNNHFRYVTEEEFRQLQKAFAVGDEQDVVPKRSPRLSHTKVFKGNKEKALEFTKNYLESLTLAAEIK